MHIISSYIHEQGVAAARGIIEAFHRTGRISGEERDWLLDVWKGVE